MNKKAAEMCGLFCVSVKPQRFSEACVWRMTDDIWLDKLVEQ